MNVVLVHGFLDSARIMSGLADRLSKAGHVCWSPTLKPSDARSGLALLSGQLESFIAATLPPDARFALIGYSMGAIISRHYLQERGGHRRVTEFISIAGPHAGTLTAFLYPGTGAREMRPRSAFLRDLEKTIDRLAGIPITCYWSPLDTLIQPASSARLQGAEHVRLAFAFHPTMTFDSRIARDIERRLAQGPNPPPGTAATPHRHARIPPTHRHPRQH